LGGGQTGGVEVRSVMGKKEPVIRGKRGMSQGGEGVWEGKKKHTSFPEEHSLGAVDESTRKEGLPKETKWGLLQ